MITTYQELLDRTIAIAKTTIKTPFDFVSMCGRSGSSHVDEGERPFIGGLLVHQENRGALVVLRLYIDNGELKIVGPLMPDEDMQRECAQAQIALRAAHAKVCKEELPFSCHNLSSDYLSETESRNLQLQQLCKERKDANVRLNAVHEKFRKLLIKVMDEARENCEYKFSHSTMDCVRELDEEEGHYVGYSISVSGSRIGWVAVCPVNGDFHVNLICAEGRAIKAAMDQAIVSLYGEQKEQE